jgi:hypothetical protein
MADKLHHLSAQTSSTASTCSTPCPGQGLVDERRGHRCEGKGRGTEEHRRLGQPQAVSQRHPTLISPLAARVRGSP